MALMIGLAAFLSLAVTLLMVAESRKLIRDAAYDADDYSNPPCDCAVCRPTRSRAAERATEADADNFVARTFRL